MLTERGEVRGDNTGLGNTLHLVWLICNQMLPRRWQVEKNDMDREYMRLLALPIQKLRDRAEAANRKANLSRNVIEAKKSGERSTERSISS
tara:strand:+ start:1903 stop:2175 length:273 start_codon:yes stop_codon:yes gene_type:complete